MKRALRARCIHCYQLVAVKKDGTFWPHRARRFSKILCQGSGRFP